MLEDFQFNKVHTLANHKSLDSLVCAAKREIAGEISDYHALSRLAPILLEGSSKVLIAELFCEYSRCLEKNWIDRPFPYMAELCALLLSHEFSEYEKSELCKKLVPQEFWLKYDNGVWKDISYIVASCARLTFSFPIWRFLAQGISCSDHPLTSILKEAGGQKLIRSTDSFINPLTLSQEDLFGPGFVFQMHIDEPAGLTETSELIELRRAYIQQLFIETASPSLLIRNSSHFFGRNRLNDFLLVSRNPIDSSGALNINSTSLTENFVSFMSGHLWRELSLASISSLKRQVLHLEAFDAKLGDWMANSSQGVGALYYLLSSKLAQDPRLIPYLSVIERDKPPWSPICSIKPDAEQILELGKFIDSQDNNESYLLEFMKIWNSRGYRLALLSGPNGDLPIR